MKNIFLIDIRFKFIAMFLVILVIPVIVIWYSVYRNMYEEIERELFNKLTTVAELKTAQVEKYFFERFANLDILSANPLIIEMLKEMETAEYDMAAKRIDSWLKKYKDIYGYYNLFVMDHDGDILYMLEEGPYLGTNIYNGRYSNTSLGKLIAEIGEKDGSGMTDFEPNLSVNGEITAFIANVILDDKGKKIGLVELEIPIKQIK